MMEPVSSITEYIERVKNINDKHFKLGSSTTYSWYRGQADASWPLTPSLYRGSHWPRFEREINRDFKLSAAPHFNHLPEDELEWLFAMQHYGAPTRLLDWSESYLNALLFAVSDTENRANAAVWILSPWELNKATLDIHSVPLASDSVLDGYRLGNPGDLKRRPDARDPAALRPTRATPRIAAQRGVFTIHGHREAGLWSIRGRKSILVKVKVCAGAKQLLRRDLHSAGIGMSSLFPGMEGVGAEIRYRYSRDCIPRA